MNWTPLEARFHEWTADMKQAAANAKSGPILAGSQVGSQEWPAVSPASFSRQLGDMHTSLLRENAPQPAMLQVGTLQAAALPAK